MAARLLKSAETNPSPVFFQNHHVAVAESAVIGYAHEIKGEGETLAFLHPKCLSRAVAMRWEIALSHQPLVAMLCQHPRVGILTQPSQATLQPVGLCTRCKCCGQKHLQLMVLSIPQGHQQRGNSPGSRSRQPLRKTLHTLPSNPMVFLPGAYVFAVLKKGSSYTQETLAAELRELISKKIAKYAAPEYVQVTPVG